MSTFLEDQEKKRELIAQIKLSPEYSLWQNQFITETLIWPVMNGETNSDFRNRIMTNIIVQNNWGRRTTYAFLCSIVDCVWEKNPNPEPLHDEIFEYLSLIEGECNPDYIIRFKNDPDEVETLKWYVRGCDWLNEEFYTGKY